MKNKWIALLVLLSVYQTGYSQGALWWSIGEKDDTGKELALASNNEYRAFIQQFGGEKLVYLIGYSSPSIHPTLYFSENEFDRGVEVVKRDTRTILRISDPSI